MALESLIHINPETFDDVVGALLDAQLVPFIKSSPGMGKSALVAEFADKHNLFLIDERLSMFENVDMKGYPNYNKGSDRAEYVPFDTFPLDDEPLVEGTDGFLVFLDEVTHASPEVIRATYELVYDRRIGGRPIHPKAQIVMAGNRAEDNALASDMGTAMNSRVVHVELVTSHAHFVTELAPKLDLDGRVVAFLAANPDHLNDFDPDNTNLSFCCQRTWHTVSKLIKGRENIDVLSPAICGAVTPAVGASFMAFTELYKDIPSLAEIEKNHSRMDLLSNGPAIWATLYTILQGLGEGTITPNAGLEYARRYSMQYVAMFFQMVYKRYIQGKEPAKSNFITSSKGYTNLSMDVGKLL